MYDRVLPVGHAYGFFWRCRAINDIAHLTCYRDAIGVPCIRAASFFSGVYSWLVMTFNYLILWVRVKGQG